MDEHPVADLEALVFEQADVDQAGDPVDVDAREVFVALVELSQLSGDAQAHG